MYVSRLLKFAHSRGLSYLACTTVAAQNCLQEIILLHHVRMPSADLRIMCEDNVAGIVCLNDLSRPGFLLTCDCS
jgi:hypothetical protein